MNKKKYTKPCVEVVKLQHQFPILVASEDAESRELDFEDLISNG